MPALILYYVYGYIQTGLYHLLGLKRHSQILSMHPGAVRSLLKNNALIPEKTSADSQLNDQLNFICKVSEDIGKITKDFTN